MINLANNILGEKIVEQGIKYIVNGTEEKLPFLLNIAEKVAVDPVHKQNVEGVRKVLQDKESNWYQFSKKLFREIHPNIKKKMAVNFFLNASLLGVPRQKEMGEKLGVSVPWAILIDPTEKCNLNCTGCWAGDYQRARDLDFETLDRVITEGEELGIYFTVVSGGEPLIRKDDLIKLAEKHPDQVIHIFTNGTLIDEDFVKEVVRVGNITFAISVEGLEESTDERRGKGVFKKVMKAMDLLREHGCLFGFSATYTRKNTEEIASDEFIDLMIEKGCTFGWLFTYIPIGKDVDLELMATPEQRAFMFENVCRIRNEKPIFVVDFWNDGGSSNGCIAGGRRYFHINAAGDVEPCAFVHYATCNIKDVSLSEALQNPLFKAYQKRQPFNKNLRRPCPLIDNPDAMVEMIKESNAKPTQLTCDETVEEFAEKLQKYANEWGKVADELISEVE